MDELGDGGGVRYLRPCCSDERMRMASDMVGWNRPPYGECLNRYVGRVLPRLKKVVRTLWRRVMMLG